LWRRRKALSFAACKDRLKNAGNKKLFAYPVRLFNHRNRYRDRNRYRIRLWYRFRFP
jgi:hypothetical protein